MKLVQELEKGHSKALTDKIVDYVGNRPLRFTRLVAVYLAGPYRVTQRAAWPLGYCIQRHPDLVKPHLAKLLWYAEQPGVHDAVKRNTVRMLQFIDIPRRYQGHVAALCLRFVGDAEQPIAVRCFSLTVLSNMVQTFPDLGRELRLIIEDQLPYYGPALRSRATRVLLQLPP